jgi:hypothetical protein
MQRVAKGGNAITGLILNGLAREARNLSRVGAYGNLSVIRRVHMMVCIESGRFIYGN